MVMDAPPGCKLGRRVQGESQVPATLLNRPPTLNFYLGETADMLRSTVEAFAADEIAPRAAEIDRSNEFPMDLWPKMGDAGRAGGHRVRGVRRRRHGLSRACRGMEEITRASASRSGCPTARIRICASTRFIGMATRSRRQRYLPGLVDGEHVGALAMSEPGAGSDVVGDADCGRTGGATGTC